MVEDRPRPLAQLLTTNLRTDGFEVIHLIESGDPEQVVGMAQETDPVMVLLELSLVTPPSAIPTIAALRASDILVVAIIDGAHQGWRTACLAAGATDAIEAVSYSEFVAAVAHITRTRGPAPQADHDKQPSMHQVAPIPQQIERLTPEHRDTLARLMAGQPATTIAAGQAVELPVACDRINAVFAKLGHDL